MLHLAVLDDARKELDWTLSGAVGHHKDGAT